MLHAGIYVIFILVAAKWLQRKLAPKQYSLTQYLPWAVAAIIAALLGALLSLLFYSSVLGNFLLHAVGGGVAAAFMFAYFIKTFRYRLDIETQFVALFLFVSGLGVLNELAEYLAETVGLGMMSFDTHDTWRDLVANSLGALLTWLCIVSFDRLVSRREK